MLNNGLSTLQTVLGYQFQQPWLLAQALTHRSFAIEHNERLEFLGDTVLNLAITQLLFKQYPATNEGDLSRSRSTLVCQDTLHQIAQNLGLSTQMRLGEGELKTGGATRPSMMADTVEALLGAVFLDSNYETVAALVEQLYAPFLQHFQPGAAQKDPKSLLQEYLQALQLPVPDYTLLHIHGAAHQQTFEVQCTVQAWQAQAIGNGTNRKLAEQAAAAAVLALQPKSQVKAAKPKPKPTKPKPKPTKPKPKPKPKPTKPKPNLKLNQKLTKI